MTQEEKEQLKDLVRKIIEQYKDILIKLANT